MVNHLAHVVLALLQSFGCLDNVEPPLVLGFPLCAIPRVMPCHELAIDIVVTQQRAPIDNKAVANHMLARHLVQVEPLHHPCSDVLRHPVRGLRQ